MINKNMRFSPSQILIYALKKISASSMDEINEKKKEENHQGRKYIYVYFRDGVKVQVKGYRDIKDYKIILINSQM